MEAKVGRGKVSKVQMMLWPIFTLLYNPSLVYFVHLVLFSFLLSVIPFSTAVIGRNDRQHPFSAGKFLVVLCHVYEAHFLKSLNSRFLYEDHVTSNVFLLVKLPQLQTIEKSTYCVRFKRSYVLFIRRLCLKSFVPPSAVLWFKHLVIVLHVSFGFSWNVSSSRCCHVNM